jgi:carboxyl-terminal processing protease
VDSVQQQRPAFKTLRLKRDVYADGGIRPDVIVPSDTTKVSDYMVKVVAKGVYNEFLLDYLDRNRDSLKRSYPTFERFDKEFLLADEQLQRLVELASVKGVEYDEAGFVLSKELMRTQLSAMVAQRLFSTSEYYRYINPRINDSYKRVVSIISEKNTPYDQLLKSLL